MLALADYRTIQEWLDRFEYMPGWKFHVEPGHPEGTLIQIRFTVPDSYHSLELQAQGVWSFVPPVACMDSERFFDWLHWRLTRIAIHEVGEFFKVDGKRPYDPHRSIEEQLCLTPLKPE